MLVSHGRNDDPSRVGTEFAPHRGEVQLDALLKADGIFVNAAVFSPSARTSWHIHADGQVIFVSGGRGVIATRDGHVEWVRAGDAVHSPSGEEHWHGAAPDCFVTYTSVSLGDVETGAEVTDDQYAAAWDR